MVVDMKRVWHYERVCDRGAGCGKTARPDLYGRATRKSNSYHFCIDFESIG